MHLNIYRLVARPTAITALPPTLSKALKDELVARVLALGEAGKTLPSELTSRLAAYPALFAVALKNNYVAETDVDRLLRDPYFAVSVLLEQYEALAPRYEERYVLPSPSALVFLVRHVRRIPTATLRPVGEYRAILAELDAVRHAGLMPIEGEEAAKATFRSKIGTARATPATALAEIWAREMREVPARLVDLLARDEEYLFLAAVLLKPHSAHSADKLVSRINAAQWAFHALLNGVATAPDVLSNLDAALKREPSWTVELWSQPIWSATGAMHGGTAPLHGRPLRVAFGELTRTGLPHPLSRELQTWYRAAVGVDLTVLVERFGAISAGQVAL